MKSLTRYDPNCRKAQELFAHLRQPGYLNKTVDAGFINKVEEVKRLFAEADGYYQSGQYDKAMKSYDKVLALDPSRFRCAQGPGRNRQHEARYGEEAYNETRARKMWKVEEAGNNRSGNMALWDRSLTIKGAGANCAGRHR